MATETVEALDEEAEGFVIDADFHVAVIGEDLLPYIDDPKLKRKLEFGMPWTRGTGGWISSYAHHNTDGRHSHGHAVSSEEIAEVMAEQGFNSVIVSPGMLGLPTARYPVLKNAVARAYNDFMLDYTIDADEGVYGLLVAPQWDPAVGVEEIERVGDAEGIVGVQGWYTPMKPFGAPEMDPLFEALTDTGLPLVLHGSGFSSRQDMQSDTLRTRAESTLFWVSNAMVNIVNMIFTGVFDKYPDLDVVIQESGVNCIPFIANHADEKYQTYPEDIGISERMYGMGKDYLDGLPSEYLFEHFYFTTQPIALPRTRADAMFEMCRADKTLLFSSDWPHHTLDQPQWVHEHPGINAALRERILHGNALDAFPRISAE